MRVLGRHRHGAAVSSAMFADYYRLLGVAPGAAPEVIRGRYRRLAASCHPDLCAGDPAGRSAAEQRMKAINAAYAVLKDPSRRAAYDAERARRVGSPCLAKRAASRVSPQRPVRVRLARPPRKDGSPGWAVALGVAALIAAVAWSRAATATDAVEAGLVSAPAAGCHGPAAALERFIAAYHAGDIAGAAQMLDPESVRIVLTGQSQRGAVRRELTCDDAAARRLLAAGFEARRRGVLSHKGDRALLVCLGGLAGGVEFQCVWGPVGPISPPVASAYGRYYVLSPAREAIPARAVFTLRRRANGWKIAAIVLHAPER